MSETMHVRNNGENPIFLTPRVGGERVRLNPGWNEVPSGYIERGTGGFVGKGANRRAKGGVFAHLFNDHKQIGKRMQPVLQVGTPVDGDDIHVVKVKPGLRSHYRTRETESRTAREVDQAKKIADLDARNEMLTRQLEQVLARLDGGAPSDTAREVDQAKKIADLDARNEMLTRQLEQVLARLDGGAPSDSAPGLPDIASMDIDRIKQAIKGLDATALRLLLADEVTNENRPAVVKLLRGRVRKAQD